MILVARAVHHGEKPGVFSNEPLCALRGQSERTERHCVFADDLASNDAAHLGFQVQTDQHVVVGDFEKDARDKGNVRADHIDHWCFDFPNSHYTPLAKFRGRKILSQNVHGMRVVEKQRAQNALVTGIEHRDMLSDRNPDNYTYSCDHPCGVVHGLALNALTASQPNTNPAISFISSPKNQPDATDSHTASRRAALRRRGTTQIQNCRALVSGAFSSCVHHRGAERFALSKPPEQTCGRPNNRSVRSLATSQECFGRRKLRRTSRRLSAVANARLNFIWPGSANGLAMQSLPSWQKFSGAIPCGISKSSRGNRGGA